MDFNQRLENKDNEIFEAISNEAKRQADQIELIASENYVSKAVLEAQGSILTNKYAEGYPNRRYYHGCDFVDVVETLAIERAKDPCGQRALVLPVAVRGHECNARNGGALRVPEESG